MINKSEFPLFQCKYTYFIGFINSFSRLKGRQLGHFVKYTFVCRIDMINKHDWMRRDKQNKEEKMRSRNIQLKYKIDIMNYDKLKGSQKKKKHKMNRIKSQSFLQFDQKLWNTFIFMPLNISFK